MGERIGLGFTNHVGTGGHVSVLGLGWCWRGGGDGVMCVCAVSQDFLCR